MIFADKLIELRKKAGYTQEELAEKMDVSRQSIAKWEGAQSVPELSKMVKLSELFGVSTDYLLKDEMEVAESTGESKAAGDAPLRRVSLEEANCFLASKRRAAGPMALGVLLCVLSPVLLIFLGCMTETAVYPLEDGLAVGIGMTALLLLVAVAVAAFISVYNQNAPYAYLDTEQIDTEYGVEGLVKDLRAKFKPIYDRCNIIGVVVCILSILPVFFGIMVDENDPILMGAMICLWLILVGAGVYLFVRVGVIWGSFERLLQEGAYSKEQKQENHSLVGAVSGAYWSVATIVYLAVSFSTNNWKTTWIIWVVAGILYPALLSILRAVVSAGNKNGK